MCCSPRCSRTADDPVRGHGHGGRRWWGRVGRILPASRTRVDLLADTRAGRRARPGGRHPQSGGIERLQGVAGGSCRFPSKSKRRSGRRIVVRRSVLGRSTPRCWPPPLPGVRRAIAVVVGPCGLRRQPRARSRGRPMAMSLVDHIDGGPAPTAIDPRRGARARRVAGRGRTSDDQALVHTTPVRLCLAEHGLTHSPRSDGGGGLRVGNRGPRADRLGPVPETCRRVRAALIVALWSRVCGSIVRWPSRP